jgi:hypothetical protein
MIADKKKFGMGLGLFVGFVAVFILMFMPLFDGQNTLNYMDNLYNTISKASAYYIPDLQAANDARAEKEISVELQYATDRRAEQAAALFSATGAAVETDGAKVEVRGDLTAIVAKGLADADAMFQNDGQKLEGQYGYPARQALYNWWATFHEIERTLKKQKQFDAAHVVAQVNKKAVETAYNYFGIEPQSIGENFWIVLLSLGFYILYTLWFGYSILFMFEGWGLNLSH